MKKKYLLFMGFIFGFFLMSNVYAAELPRTGVTYFITYPNGEETVTESYDEASSDPEKIIFEGMTDSDGKVILEGLDNIGELRIVQNIPNGYSSDSKEYTIDLSQTRSIEIINKNLTNPKTSPIIISIVVLVFVLASLLLFRMKNVKKIFLMIVTLSTILILSQVHADSGDVVIKVQDDEGNALAGVFITVYAKPSNVDGVPAVKFSANGGYFYDGETVMYVKLSEEGCNFYEMIDALPEDEQRYITENAMNAYRSNYYPTPQNMWESYPENLHNGDVVNLAWESDPSAQLVKVYGNGGIYNFYGKKLTEITTYTQRLSYLMRDNLFSKDGEYLIGYDNRSSCSIYDEYGIITNGSELDEGDVYACWHSNPDGIYVNEMVFVGNNDSCFVQSISNYGGYVALQNGRYQFVFDANAFGGIYDNFGGDAIDITSVQIVNHGSTYLSLSRSDLEYNNNNQGYYITNSSKYNTYTNVVNSLINSCGYGSSNAT